MLAVKVVVLAEHCSSEEAAVEVMYLASSAAVEVVLTECCVKEAEVGRARDLVVEEVPPKALGSL